MADFHPYDEALARYRAGGHRPRPLPEGALEPVDLLREFHPDYQEEAQARLAVGPNRGERCQAQVADLLQSNGLVDEIDLAGAPVRDTDVVIVGGGGAGCAAALAAAEQGARVTLLTKLQLGDSNTVMAEGGMQAAVGADDTPQLHYDDT
ncbi:MAG: FAD-dependent oxidoreductase, partial [Chloroflexia bacterium]|nr:FAD-dependent oxidoreductase [Chloroflexia bacterium]